MPVPKPAFRVSAKCPLGIEDDIHICLCEDKNLALRELVQWMRDQEGECFDWEEGQNSVVSRLLERPFGSRVALGSTDFVLEEVLV